ncbi:hypothetical protein BU25DRAFT_488487 [Macroventuria anomochaeta]|uniref:Uncharacterized protein n=1 Tax=Macroventuria anomochaeta TaxID=301207 RepID=A0ACB6SAN5_9PLEO|nr:uncharacterized protein BU25DRAFT_488487 [Macroventuria anomochaeta]KAF2631037.1 hypothetical protein BU25DRAFT_488487 [Macroventuria anomochaeta]
MISSPSLCPLFPSTIHICQLSPGSRDERPERHETNDNNRRRFYGNINMQLNSSRLPLNPDHIATQMREQSSSDEELTPAPPQPLRRTARVVRRPLSMTRSSTPPPTGTLPSRRAFYRRGATATTPLEPDDTRRHGMILEDTEDRVTTHPDTLPSYSPVPYTPFRRVTDDGTLSEPLDARTVRNRQSRQRELRELQRQWNVRRRTHPTCETERTQFRALVSEAYDLPPPYAPRDPYPLFKTKERKPSIWSRVVLYPFVPEGELLNKAAFATDRMAAKVAFGVKQGVEEVGKKAMAVPRRIESKRAERKIKWLENRGYVDTNREREDYHQCSAYAGAYHVT